MSRGQGEPAPRELVFREGFVGIDTPLEEELAAALEGVPYKIYVGLVRLFRGRPGGTTMRELAEQLHQRHAQVVTTLGQLEALHLVAYETSALGTWVEVLPCSAQALVALRQKAEERLGAGARFSRRANQRLLRARDELGLPQPAPQQPRPKRRRPSGGRADGPTADALSTRRRPPSEAPAREGDGGTPAGSPPPPGSPGRLAEASPWAAGSQVPQPAAELPRVTVDELASEPPPAHLPSPEPLADRLPAGGGLASQPAQPSCPAVQPVAALQEPAAPSAGPEPAPGEPPAASRPAPEALAGQPGGEPAAEPEAPAAVLAEVPGQLTPAAEGLPGMVTATSSPPQPASHQPAEARTEGSSEATDEGQGDQLGGGKAVAASRGLTETAAPREGPEAPDVRELAAGRREVPPAAWFGGALTRPRSGALAAPPPGGAPNCSLDRSHQIPPSFPPPARVRGASRADGRREECLVPSATEPARQPTPAARPGAPPAPEPPASNGPALEAMDALVKLACSLWLHQIHAAAAERWLLKGLALVEPAPSRGEMAAFLRWAAEDAGLAKAAVPLAAALSPGRFVPWITRRRAKFPPPQTPGAAPPGALQAARDAAESRRREAPVARVLRFAGQPEHPWPGLGAKAPATPAPGALVGTPAPRAAAERAVYEQALTFLPADLRAEGLALLDIPRTERTDLQRQRFTRLQQLALQAEARGEQTSLEATERAARGAESEASHDPAQE